MLLKGELKILKIKFSNIRIFHNEFEINFIAKDRVFNQSLFNIYNSIYTQNLVTITGVNASGKTTALRLINFAMEVVINNRSLNEIVVPQNLFSDSLIMEVIFVYNEEIYQLKSEIVRNKNNSKLAIKNDFKLEYSEEVLKKKSIYEIKNRQDIFDFEKNDYNQIIRSKMPNEIKNYLKPEDSIVISVTRGNIPMVIDIVEDANLNYIKTLGETPKEIINLLDGSIEYIKGQKNHEENGNDDVYWELKFKNQDTIYKFAHPVELQNILSSGTIRGNNVLALVLPCLITGGYFFIDEIENHFNKQIIKVIIDLFKDKEINTRGATLIMTTHYIEILDFSDRKDNIYVLIRDENYYTKLVLFSNQVKRNDLKKSEVLQANKILGSAPKYENIKVFYDFLKNQLKEKSNEI